MDFKLSPQEEAFRQEFKVWLKEALPHGWDPYYQPTFNDHLKTRDSYRAFQKKLFEAGFAGMHYDRAYGGQGQSSCTGYTHIPSRTGHAIVDR